MISIAPRLFSADSHRVRIGRMTSQPTKFLERHGEDYAFASSSLSSRDVLARALAAVRTHSSVQRS